MPLLDLEFFDFFRELPGLAAALLLLLLEVPPPPPPGVRSPRPVLKPRPMKWKLLAVCVSTSMFRIPPSIEKLLLAVVFLPPPTLTQKTVRPLSPMPPLVSRSLPTRIMVLARTFRTALVEKGEPKARTRLVRVLRLTALTMRGPVQHPLQVPLPPPPPPPPKLHLTTRYQRPRPPPRPRQVSCHEIEHWWKGLACEAPSNYDVKT